MFPTTATAHNVSIVSICLRCQFRLLMRQRTQQKRPRRPLNHLVSRLFTSGPSISQQALQAKDLTFSDEDIIEDHPRDWLDPRLEYYNKYQKAFLDINALGKRGEVLLMPDLRDKEIDNVFEKKEVVEGNVAMDSSQILDKIDGEDEMVGSERVTENLENIRLTWRQDRSKALTTSELAELARSLYDGFTKRQLLHYFLLQSSRHLDPHLELLSVYSTDLYKRSQWKPGSTPFPGDALRRLDDLNAEIEAKKGSSKVHKPFAKYRMKGTTKHFIVDQIIRQRWHLRTEEYLKSSGELDIWISRDHLKVLLNHRREHLRGLAQQYEAKIDASKSLAVLRVTADFDTCGEVFKSIVYLLENIHMSEISLPLDEFSVGQGAKHEEMSIRSLLDQVAKVTSTVIRPLFNVREVNASEEKLRIYHLGPGDEDLEDVRRVLSQTLRRTTPKTSFAFWTGGEKLQNARPVLAETEKGLPLIKRGKQWARWSCGTKRKPELAKKPDELKRADETGQAKKKMPLKSKDGDMIEAARALGMHGKILKSLIGQAKNTSLMSRSAIPGAPSPPAHGPSLEGANQPDSFWGGPPARKTSAVIGHILYPWGTSERTKSGRKGPKPVPVLGVNKPPFNSRREILTSITGPRTYLQKSRLCDIEEREELRIILTPAHKTDPAGSPRVFPGLILYARIDPDTKEASLAEVRLILEEREADLLLPDEAADIRFLAESFLPAAGEVDPEIMKFFKASFLDVTGHQRLRTPQNLRLLIPAHAVRMISEDSSDASTSNSSLPPEEAAKSGVSVEYTFTSLEHCSVIAGFDVDSGFRIQYSVVEAGETGGKRDELRMMFAKQPPKTPKDRGRGCGRLRSIEEGAEELAMTKKGFERFYDAAVSLV